MRLCRGATFFFLFAAVLAAALTGCVKFKQDVTVMPDGSGKIDFRMGFNKKGVEEAATAMGQGGAGTMEDPTDFDMSDFEDMAGFVAFTAPKQEEKDGWKYTSFTGYFEDVNKLKMTDDDDSGQLSFAFGKTETGFTLKVQSHFSELEGLGQMDDFGGGEDVPEEMKGMMEGMKKLVEGLMENFEFSQSFTMPGAITSASGVTSKEGRTAVYAISGKDLKEKGQAAKAAEMKEFAIECGASAVTEAELAAFKAELAKAKEEWEKIER